MSIAALVQVYDEVRRLAIAGSNLAPGDFRLKKLVPTLEKAGEKAPVFAKVAETIRRLVEGGDKAAPQTLLELSTLVGAVLYTQGETGSQGELEPIETTDLGPLETGTSARVLKPLIEALSTTGSGRLEIIRDAVERDAFRDLRLVNPALRAIDDSYAEIADLVAERVLPRYGRAIYPQLRERFDSKGRGGHVRRLKLMHQVDPESTRDLVEQSLESGSKEMKIAALACLKGSPAGLPHLLEQVNAKAKDVREAAFEGMSETVDPEVTAAFKKGITGKDLDIAAEPASRNPDPDLLAWLLEEGRAQLAGLLSKTAKTKAEPLVDRFQQFLVCFTRRNDSGTIAFLGECFDRRGELAKLPGKIFDGESIVQKIASLLCHTRSESIMRLVAAAHATLPAGVLPFAFVAAALVEKPAAVYATFSPYLAAKSGGRSRKATEAEERRAQIELVLQQLGSPRAHRRLYWYHGAYVDLDVADRAAEIELDGRWLDAAIEIDALDLVITLLRPNHARAAKYLESKTRDLLKRKDADWPLIQALEAMIDMGHPRATPLYLETLERHLGKPAKKTYYGYHAYWLGRLIPKLPGEAVADLEALLPNLHENAVDAIADSIVELKSRGV